MMYLVLFETAMDRVASVESLLERWDEGWRSWGMGFLRNFNGWEIEWVGSFFQLLESHVPIREGEDRMRWKLKRSGEFTVHETLQGPSLLLFPWKAIWWVKAPLRVSFFLVWLLSCGVLYLGRLGFSGYY